MNSQKLIDLGVAVIRTEAAAVSALESRIDETFVRACELLFACTGKVIVSGMGKSGHIGSKIAATMASTGTPAFFVHPGEASHGDLGMIGTDDVLIALSNSGETQELVSIAPLVRRRGIPLIALTGNPESTIAELANVHINIGVAGEACPLGLAPTASTTASLALGDALAIALLERRGFTPDDFARSHPGGALGRRLLLHVGDIMRRGDKIPRVRSGTLLTDALFEMSNKGLGMTVVVDENDRELGVFTDGDLRRTLDQDADLRGVLIDDSMTRSAQKMTANSLAADAVQLMQTQKITSVLIVDDGGQLSGILHMHDLLAAGVL